MLSTVISNHSWGLFPYMSAEGENMGLSQDIWSLDDKVPLSKATLKTEKEREDLLDQNIELLNASWLMIGRQVWTTLGKIYGIICLYWQAY